MNNSLVSIERFRCPGEEKKKYSRFSFFEGKLRKIEKRIVKFISSKYQRTFAVAFQEQVIHDLF